MSEQYRIGLHLAIKAQWAFYRSWVRRSRKANTLGYARLCMETAEMGRSRAVDLERELAAD